MPIGPSSTVTLYRSKSLPGAQSDACGGRSAPAQVVSYDACAKRDTMGEWLANRFVEEKRLKQALPVTVPHPLAHVQPAKQKTVLVCCSEAGAGHLAAASAIKQALGTGYRVVQVNPFDFACGVPLLGEMRGVDLYNTVQAHGPILALDLLGALQRLAAPMDDTLHTGAIETLLAEHKPDAVITVVPMGHGALFKATQARRIPMVVVPTDLEFGHFVDQIRAPSALFKLALPFADLRSQASQLPEHAFAVTGYPVRPEFDQRNVGQADLDLKTSHILQTLGVHPRDTLVMIMMGGGGVASDRVLAQARALLGGLPDAIMQAQGDTTPGQPHLATTHVVCVCGRNTALRESLQQLADAPSLERVHLHAVGLCDGADVAALMHRAGVLVTKPGGATVNEALAAGCFQLYDRSIDVPHWEYANATYTCQAGMGAWSEPQELVKQVAQAVLSARPQAAPNRTHLSFARGIRQVVGDLLATRNAQEAP